MSRLVTVLLAFLLLGAGLPLSTAAAEEELPAAVPAEEAAETPAAPLPEQPAAPPAAAGEEGAGDQHEKLEERLEEALDSLLEKPVTAVDEAHGRISTEVLATARWFDAFFADPRVENEVGKTRVKLRFSVFAEEEATTEYEVQANVRLDLPVLEGKLHLLLAGDPEEDDDFQALTGREGTLPELASVNENISASLRYFLVQTLYRNISVRAGLRLRKGTPTLFIEPRYRLSIPFDHWLFRFTQRGIAFTDGTVGVPTTVDLERDLGHSLFFRTTADGSWFSDEEGYFYNLGFTLFHSLPPRRVLVYSWVNSFRTRPNDRLEEVVLSVRYREQIWREWFFYEIAPQLSFPHEQDFKTTPGVFLRLEMLFGDYPKPPQKAEPGQG